MAWLRWIAAGLMLSLSAFPGRAADDACIMHLDLDTREGELFRDMSGHGHHGRPQDTPAVPGVHGHGIVIGRLGQCVAVAPPAPLREPIPALTMECWIALDKLIHVGGIIGTGDFYANREPFGLWLNFGKVDFHGMRTDGKRIEGRSRGTAITTMTRPDRTWYHVVGVYDGVQARTYVNGELVFESVVWESAPLIGLERPILVGKMYGSDWQTLNGAIDEVRLYTRALSAAEVGARYAARADFKPAPLVKEFPGTLDGRAYSGTGRYDAWVQGSMPHGAQANFSNIGDVNLDIREFNDTWTFAVLDQRNRRERFWREVDGRWEQDVDSGAYTYEIRGLTHHGLRMAQTARADAEGRLTLRYEIEAPEGRGPIPFLPMLANLPSASSIRFVGHSDEGPVTGFMPDLDRTVRFREVFDRAVLDRRVGLRLSPGVEYEMQGSRDPRRWQNGYSGFPGRIWVPDFKAWEAGRPWVVELTVHVRGHEAEPWLDAATARRITEDKRFDFSPVYQPDSNRIAIVPIGRRVHVYGHDETVSLRVQFPTAMRPRKLRHRIVNSASATVVAEGLDTLSPDWWNLQTPLLFEPPERGVYLVTVTALDADDTELGSATQEVAVAGPIPQPTLAPGAEPALTLVDEADLTRDDDHDYFSYSGQAQVVEIEGQRYRQTLTFDRAKESGIRHDWIGCRLRVKHPMRPHLVVVEHANLDGMNMAINILEPRNEGPEATQSIPLNRGLSGVWTGAGYPADNRLSRTSIVYFPSASWIAVTLQNIHDRFMADKPPATVARVRLYEWVDELPQLGVDAYTDRLLGVFAEGGTLGLGAFGDRSLRGALARLPPGDTFYREALTAVENLARYLRYRGDSVYLYGAVRYRTAEYPGITAPPLSGMERGDLVALIAKVFEYNGLKLLLAIEANELINVQRLPGYTGTPLSDIHAGADHLRQITPDGLILPGAFGHAANPFHPAVQAEYAHLAEEIGALYKDYPAVAGIAWMTGNEAITCPTLLISRWQRREDEKWPRPFVNTYDDTTMRQFAEHLGRPLPGTPGDPGRYRERFEWIMNHALDEWTHFRCRRIAGLYAAFTDALRRAAPDKELFVIDDHMGTVTSPQPAGQSGLRRLRTYSFDPREFTGHAGLRFALMMPPHWEWFDRGRMRGNPNWLADSTNWWNDAELWSTLDPVHGGVFLHRQFEEKGIHMPADRDWVFPRGSLLGTCNYPQPVERQNLKQFADILARSTPRLLCWMWCDDGMPIGHEQSMREFAHAYRQLPLGAYETVAKVDQTVVRRCADAGAGTKAWYVVNTGSEPAALKVQPPAAGRFRDAYGREHSFVENQPVTLDLKPYELCVFVPPAVTGP